MYSCVCAAVVTPLRDMCTDAAQRYVHRFVFTYVLVGCSGSYTASVSYAIAVLQLTALQSLCAASYGSAQASPPPPVARSQQEGVMTAKREVQDRMVAATSLLQNLVGSGSFDQVSSVQGAVIEQMIMERSLSLGELAELSTTARESAFAANDKATIMKAISAKAGSCNGGSAKTDEKKKQDFTNIPHVLPQTVWDALASHDDGPSALFEHALVLGLREANEFTYAMMAILIMFCAEGQENALRMTHAAKLAQVNAVRGWFKRMASRAPAPVENIKSLPASASALLNKYPRTYAAAFPDGSPPVVCKIDPLVLEMLRGSTRCRNTLKLMQSNRAVATGMQGMQGIGMQGMQGMQGMLCPMIGDQPQQQVMSMIGVALREIVNGLQGQARTPQKPDDSADVPLQFPGPRQPDALSPQLGSPVDGTQRRAESVGADASAVARESGDGLRDGGATINAASTRTRRKSVAEASAAIAEAYSKIKDKRAEAAKEKKAAEKEARKLAKEAEKEAKKAAAKPAPMKAMKAVKAMKAATAEVQTSATDAVAPSYSHEASRHQFMARTGVRGAGNSHRFSYEAGSKRSMDAALGQARKYVADECKRRCIPVPAKCVA